jgi:hypothetical protein
MLERLFKRCGPHFILVMMLVTRAFCLVGGALVIYYVDLTIRMEPATRERFMAVAGVWIVLSTVATVCVSVWETSALRTAIGRLLRNEVLDRPLAERAGTEAVLYAGRHHRRESILVPATTVIPLCAQMWLTEEASFSLLLQVTIAGFLGISAVLLLTFFAAEKWMAVVTRYLIANSVPIPFDSLPSA